MERRRFKQTVSLKDRLALFAEEVRQKALQLRPGPEQDALQEGSTGRHSVPFKRLGQLAGGATSRVVELRWRLFPFRGTPAHLSESLTRPPCQARPRQ
jgi:hypothetical protein